MALVWRPPWKRAPQAPEDRHDVPRPLDYSKHNRPYLLGSHVEVADTLRKYHAYAKSVGVTVTKYYTDNAPRLHRRQR